MNRGGTLSSESHQPIDTVAVQEYQGLIIAVHPLKNESDSTETCRELVPAKKEFDGVNPNYNDDEYLCIVRGITSVPHDFAPERVVTPVYTVPRYPDNHNPLLPLSLQKKLGESSFPIILPLGMQVLLTYFYLQAYGYVTCIFKTCVECGLYRLTWLLGSNIFRHHELQYLLLQNNCPSHEDLDLLYDFVRHQVVIHGSGIILPPITNQNSNTFLYWYKT